MVLNQKHVLLLVALIAVNLIFAQDSPGEADNEHENAPPEDHNEDESDQNRFFFTRYVACNYTAQAGRTCANCRQTLLCLPSNIGILRTCKGFLLSYCNQGVCSWIGGSACNGTTAG